MPSLNVTIRPADKTDLDAINRVIESAVMGWQLPERVKRLSLPSYRYDTLDFDHLEMVVAEDDEQQIIGIASWQQADSNDSPANQSALLLHGIYVEPASQHRGIGRQLFHSAEKAARKHGYQGLLVKAQQDASAFFIAQGMHRLQTEDPSRQYANRFWKDIE
jgi:predicted N-acetyltransferase YhbS